MVENNTASVDDELSYFFSVPNIVVCTLGVVSNALLLVAFIKNPLKCFRNSGTCLVMNLSVSDSLTCLLCLALNIIRKISCHWVLGFFINLIVGVPFASMASVSIDRFWMVSSPIRHRILMKGKIIVLWIAGIWIVNFLIAFILIISHVSYANEKRGLVEVSNL